MLIYSFTLTQVALALGILYLGAYLTLLLKPAQGKALALAFPRHYQTGLILTGVATVWFVWLLQTADLMEYTPHRTKFVVGFIALAIASCFYLKEFLSVRAAGVLALLFAKVMLDAAFLRDEPVRLVITVLAYLFIVKGMILVASPYLLRDAVVWVFHQPERANVLSYIGIGLGVVLVSLGLFVY
ncbi:MAG: hypothetical protein AAFY98_05635 [Verrucomicrobiota bacterium]